MGNEKIFSDLSKEGLLTAPTCSQGLNWFIAKEILKALANQLYKFTDILTHHDTYAVINRPVALISDHIINASKD